MAAAVMHNNSMMLGSRRPLPNAGVSMSTSHRDVTDSRYRDLRRPRKVTFYSNGDRYFTGKLLYITPHRFTTFNELLDVLTSCFPGNVNLPYGVRQVFEPRTGKRLHDIEALLDGHSYVCAGFEPFKKENYGGTKQPPWAASSKMAG